MKTLGIVTIVIGMLMLLAGMSGDYTQRSDHDTFLIYIGPVFALIGISITVFGLVKNKKP